MRHRAKRSFIGLPFASVLLVACSGGEQEQDASAANWSALLNDGAALTSTLGDGASTQDAASNRYCTECSTTPLAWWKFDFCNAQSTQLDDSANSTSLMHPAFRAVSVDCVAGREGEAVRLAAEDDIIYSPDQPDYDFSQGLTVAAWLKPDSVDRTQSIVRKRLDGTSAFVLAIQGGELEFALRLNKRKLAGISAPILPGRFTHVAASYDGQEMRLYVDGALAAQRDASGTISAGAGPIFIGNDSLGREFKGTIDEVWLNTLAAPLDTIESLNCSRMPPVVTISPQSSSPIAPNTPFAFDVAVTNSEDPTFCSPANYLLSPTLPYPLTTDSWYAELSVPPGQTGHATVNVSAADTGNFDPVTFYYTVYNQANYSMNATAQATFVIAAPSP